MMNIILNLSARNASGCAPHGITITGANMSDAIEAGAKFMDWCKSQCDEAAKAVLGAEAEAEQQSLDR